MLLLIRIFGRELSLEFGPLPEDETEAEAEAPSLPIITQKFRMGFAAEPGDTDTDENEGGIDNGAC